MAEETEVATAEVEVMEAPEVAGGEAAEGEEDLDTSRPPRALRERAARRESDSWLR